MKLVICKQAPHKDEIMDDRQSGHLYQVQIHILRQSLKQIDEIGPTVIIQGKEYPTMIYIPGPEKKMTRDEIEQKLLVTEKISDDATIQNIINQVNGAVGWQGHHDYPTDPAAYEVIEIEDYEEVKKILKQKKEITHHKDKTRKFNKWTEIHPDLKAKKDKEVKDKQDKKDALKAKLGLNDEDLVTLKELF